MTTEMPPSGMVDVNVVVTFFDDTAVLDVLVGESAAGVVLDVSKVVPCDVVRATKYVSKVFLRLGNASPWLLRQNVLQCEEHVWYAGGKEDINEACRLFPGTRPWHT